MQCGFHSKLCLKMNLAWPGFGRLWLPWCSVFFLGCTSFCGRFFVHYLERKILFPVAVKTKSFHWFYWALAHPLVQQHFRKVLLWQFWSLCRGLWAQSPVMLHTNITWMWQRKCWCGLMEWIVEPPHCLTGEEHGHLFAFVIQSVIWRPQQLSWLAFITKFLLLGRTSNWLQQALVLNCLNYLLSEILWCDDTVDPTSTKLSWNRESKII